MAKKKSDPQKRNRIILGAITIFIMVGSGLAIFDYTPSNPNDQSFNGFTFSQVNDTNLGLVWTTKVNGKPFYFSYSPFQTGDVATNGTYKSLLLDADAIIITTAPPGEQPTKQEANYISGVAYLLSINLHQLGKQVVPAFTNATGYNITQASCATASSQYPVIYLTYGNASRIRTADSCVTLEGSNAPDLFVEKDQLLYTVLGVFS